MLNEIERIERFEVVTSQGLPHIIVYFPKLFSGRLRWNLKLRTSILVPIISTISYKKKQSVEGLIGPYQFSVMYALHY